MDAKKALMMHIKLAIIFFRYVKMEAIHHFTCKPILQGQSLTKTSMYYVASLLQSTMWQLIRSFTCTLVT